MNDFRMTDFGSVVEDDAELAEASGAQPMGDPVATQAAERMRLADAGLEVSGGQSARAASWQPQSKTGAIPEAEGQYDERQEHAQRERMIEDERVGLDLDANQLARDFNKQQQLDAHERVMRQEQRTAQIDADVSQQRAELDDTMADQRKLIDRGISPYALYGHGDETAGRMTAALSMMAAGFAGPEYAALNMQMINGIIDREVTLAQSEIQVAGAAADTAYSRLRDSYGDQEQADSAMKILMLDAAKAELEGMILSDADPRTVLAAQESLLAIDQELLQANDAYNARAYGNRTESYDRGQSYIAPGTIMQMSHEKWMTHLEKRSGIQATEADTASTWAKTMEMERANMPGTPPPEMKGISAKQLSGMQGHIKMDLQMQDLFEAMGFDHRDPSTGEVTGTISENLPGKGPLGSMMRNIPGWDPEGVALQTKIDHIFNTFRLTTTGQQSSEKELRLLKQQMDSWSASNLEVRMKEFSTIVAHGRSAARGAMPTSVLEYLDAGVERETRRGTAKSPGQYGANKARGAT